MFKKVIAILSVLKPVDDTRNLEKIAASLGNTNKYDINIIGFSAKNLRGDQNITFHPLFDFKRLSIARLLASFKILQKIIKLKPELVIVTCAELLVVTCAYKIIFGTKIIYDIQENYYRNIIHTTTYPKLLRHMFGMLVRASEWLTAPFISRFVLAEKVYQYQLNFINNRFEIVGNKAIIPSGLKKKKASHKTRTTFLYTGTIATHYGIFDAVSIIKELHALNKEIEFRIVGFAPDKRVFDNLIIATKGHDYIKIIGGTHLIPHNQILKEIQNADFCLLPYHKNMSTEGRLPTKLFECLALEIPIIITPNSAWNDIVIENNAGIIHDFLSGVIPSDKLEPVKFYGHDLSNRYLWNKEESKLLSVVDQLI